MTDRCIMLCRALAAALLLCAPLGAAGAADMRMAPAYKAPGYPAPVFFSWSGFYLGVNAGYGFGWSNWTSAAVTTGGFGVNGAVAGGTIGYNVQTGAVVWGIEADFDWSNIKGSTTTACAGGCQTKNAWLGTGRFRVGYAFDRWLPYITAGGAYGDIKATSALGSSSSSEFGWTAGVGLEWAFLANWSAKVEYLYVDLGGGACTGACSPVTPVTVDFKTSLVRAGINYRF